MEDVTIGRQYGRRHNITSTWKTFQCDVTTGEVTI